VGVTTDILDGEVLKDVEAGVILVPAFIVEIVALDVACSSWWSLPFVQMS